MSLVRRLGEPVEGERASLQNRDTIGGDGEGSEMVKTASGSEMREYNNGVFRLPQTLRALR